MDQPEKEPLERIADALERIADVLEGGFDVQKVVRYVSGRSQWEQWGEVIPKEKSD